MFLSGWRCRMRNLNAHLRGYVPHNFSADFGLANHQYCVYCVKMEGNNLHYRHILLHYFKKGATATKARQEICDVYGENALTERECQNWFTKFRSGDFDINNAPRSSEIDSNDVQPIINENLSQSVREIATALHMTPTTVENHLRQLGFSNQR